MWGSRRRGSRADARAIKRTRECGQSVKPPPKSQYYLQDILWCLQGLDKDKTGWVGGLGEGQGFEVEKGEGDRGGGGHCHSPTVLSPPQTTATTSVSPTNLPPAYFNTPCNCPFPLPFYLPAPPPPSPPPPHLALISSIIFPTFPFSRNDHCKCKHLNEGTVHLEERPRGAAFGFLCECLVWPMRRHHICIVTSWWIKTQLRSGVR